MSRWRPLAKTPWWIRCLPTWLHGPAILLFRLSLACLMAVVGISVFYFLKASEYDLAEVGKLPLENIYFDAAGNTIESPGKSGRPLVEREEIPDFLVNALIAREDARFFEHCGVDFRGLARATIRNIKDRDFTQGASTLSMQLARNSL